MLKSSTTGMSERTNLFPYSPISVESLQSVVGISFQHFKNYIYTLYVNDHYNVKLNKNSWGGTVKDILPLNRKQSWNISACQRACRMLFFNPLCNNFEAMKFILLYFRGKKRCLSIYSRDRLTFRERGFANESRNPISKQILKWYRLVEAIKLRQ